MSKDKMTVNYPFEKMFQKNTGEKIDFHLETPWVDEDTFWEQSNTEVIADYPNLKVVKSDYDNGFKVIFIETGEFYLIKTNWELDKVKEGRYLPKIQ